MSQWTRSFLSALVGAAALTAPLVAQGTPKPSGARGFRLLARAATWLDLNRVQCGVTSTGELCTNVDNSTSIGGAWWPKHSPQQYMFNSGLQVAGIIQDTLGWAWAGDTTGGFF
ncbi:MAG TPA: hypothetical protein VG940_02880, partial [Gemmatimonadales bacterium]|nr:hypothetical protein [Gemmatimonadales bacterium]